MEEKVAKELYKELKAKALSHINKILLKCKDKEGYRGDFGEDVYKKLQELSREDGLIEVGSAAGDGYDCNGNHTGYYMAHLVVNMNNFAKEDYENVIYLAISYVPQPDSGYGWVTKEFSESENFQYSKAFVLLQYLRVFCSEDEAFLELERLSRRKYPMCVEDEPVRFS